MVCSGPRERPGPRAGVSPPLYLHPSGAGPWALQGFPSSAGIWIFCGVRDQSLLLDCSSRGGLWGVCWAWRLSLLLPVMNSAVD